MAQLTFFFQGILGLFFFFSGQASLFFGPQEKTIQRPDPPPQQNKSSLKLEAIFYRLDVNHWIVWINGHRIDSRHPQSINGWHIVHVTHTSVTLRSSQGQEKILLLDRN